MYRTTKEYQTVLNRIWPRGMSKSQNCYGTTLPLLSLYPFLFIFYFQIRISERSDWDSYSSISKRNNSQVLFPPCMSPTLSISPSHSSNVIKQGENSEKVPVTYTAMHGVGSEWVTRAFEAFGLAPYVPVPLQISADPEFPTVAFPNPEEGKGALVCPIDTPLPLLFLCSLLIPPLICLEKN